MIVGNKELFAIEWKERTPVSPVRVWVSNFFIGTFDESQMLGVVAHQFKELINRVDEIALNYGKLDVERIFELLLAEESGKHLISLGESFDDFCVLVYANEDLLNFVWRLEPDPYFDYPQYGYELKSGAVPLEYFLGVVEDYKSVVSNYV